MKILKTEKNGTNDLKPVPLYRQRVVLNRTKRKPREIPRNVRNPALKVAKMRKYRHLMRTFCFLRRLRLFRSCLLGKNGKCVIFESVKRRKQKKRNFYGYSKKLQNIQKLRK